MPVYEFHVEMTCSGCSGAVDRVLKKNLGDDAKFDIDLEGKKVSIDSEVSQQQLTEYLKKTGKEISNKHCRVRAVMASNNIEELMRAREVQSEALAELNARVQACKESMHNYECLSDRISTLPDKLSHPVMVPFGKLAFMPGKLVHTNELLVHLGDTWFSEMTCKQGLKVIEQRQHNLQATFGDLEKIRNNFESKSEYMEEMESLAKGRTDEVEIKEECTTAYTHPKDRQRISRLKEKVDVESTDQQKNTQEDEDTVKAEDIDGHDALMRRLDELEKLEEEEDELYRLSDSESSEGKNDDVEELAQEKQTESKHVKWKDRDGENETSTSVANCCTIRFEHTEAQVGNASETCEMTPGDVHKLVQTKSILKKHCENTPSQLPMHREEIGEHLDKTVPTVWKQTAVSDVVVERSTAAGDTTVEMSSKPVSRFKAGRKKLS